MNIITTNQTTKVKAIAALLGAVMMALVACNNGNKSNDDQAFNEARQAYASCIANRGPELCNRVKAGSTMSVNEYFGQRTFEVYDQWGNSGNAAYGWNNGYGYNQGNDPYNSNSRVNATSIDRAYMDGYIRSLPESQILEMKRRWEDIAAGRDNDYNQIRNCGFYGC